MTDDPWYRAQLARYELVVRYRRRADRLRERADALASAPLDVLALRPVPYFGGAGLREHEEALDAALTAL